MLRALTTQLIREGRVTTTKARAKALRDEAERMITLAKDGSLASRRRAMGIFLLTVLAEMNISWNSKQNQLKNDEIARKMLKLLEKWNCWKGLSGRPGGAHIPESEPRGAQARNRRFVIRS